MIKNNRGISLELFVGIYERYADYLNESFTLPHMNV